MKRTKRKTVWAYLDGKKLVDVVQAALDNNIDRKSTRLNSSHDYRPT